jgi:hypothetical protein
MPRPSILRATLPPLAALLAAVTMGCPTEVTNMDAALDQPRPDGDAAGDGDGAAEAAVPACEMNLPRCDFPDGGAPANVINQGRLQALSLCNFCHQDATPGAGEFTGQLQPRPMTMAYGTNLSPDMETGIGALTDEQIGRAARCATGRSGRRLCAMAPFAETRLSNDNLCALIAYLRSLPPVRRQIPASTCP